MDEDKKLPALGKTTTWQDVASLQRLDQDGQDSVLARMLGLTPRPMGQSDPAF